MDDLDARIGEQLVERGVGARRAEDVGPSLATFRVAAQDSTHLDADPAQSLDVHRADEAGADNGGADVGDPSHARITTLL